MTQFLTALAATFQPFSLMMLATGVLLGLILGVIPGVGALFGMVLLIPLTYHMDAYAAVALLLGIGSVTTTSDTIPAVLIGLPGSAGAITTVQDGHPLAKQGQASRAFGAAYLSSMIGGVFGALVLALMIPIMRPLILAMKTPDFLAVAMVGLLFVSFVSGRDGLKGLAAVLAGIMLSFIGLDPHSGAERYTNGVLFLWDGLPLAATFIGVFGLSEIAGLLRRRSISEAPAESIGLSSLTTGFRDVLREWWLVIQCSAIGALVGAIPGIGVIVIDWIAYGVATRNRRGGPPFGEGNIRGVIAPESANNAKEGGHLIPTIAFGLPGSATMTILLAAFTIHGLVPGPDMLTKNLSVTYSMVFYIAIANILGALICMAFTGQLARLATVPSAYIVPISLLFVTFGVFQESGRFESILVLLIFGVAGMFMKARAWPRAAMALGFILGPNIERYFFLSTQISGFDWLTRPSIVIALGCLVILLVRLAMRWKQAAHAGAATHAGLSEPLSYVAVGGLALYGFTSIGGMQFSDRLFPQIVAGALIATSLLLLVRYFLTAEIKWPERPALSRIRFGSSGAIVVLSCATIAGLIYVVGHAAAAVLFVGGFVALAQREGLTAPILAGGGSAIATWAVFDLFVASPWPTPLLAAALPFG